MILPKIEIEKIEYGYSCSIKYENINARMGYKFDGTPFVFEDGDIIEVGLKFTRISCGMWDAICDKYKMNPGNALQEGLIEKKYCTDMSLVSTIGYDLANMKYHKEKTNRNLEEFFEEFLK